MKWQPAFGERVVRNLTRNGLAARVDGRGLRLTAAGREVAQQVMVR
jgi:Mn-dependent DtxR family transcriptional regulator